MGEPRLCALPYCPRPVCCYDTLFTFQVNHLRDHYVLQNYTTVQIFIQNVSNQEGETRFFSPARQLFRPSSIVLDR